MKLFKSQDFFAVIVILLFSFFAIQPLFTQGFFTMHDDTQIARVFAMTEAIKDDQFPVRVVEYLGYGLGYPIFNFYAPLAYYIGALFALLGFTVVTATEVMVGLGIVLAGIFMYILSREFWGKIGGIVAGLFYIYAPYHSVNSYVRGAISELWAYAFIPVVVYGFYKVYESSAAISEKSKVNKSKVSPLWKYIGIASLGFAGIILSHNLTAMMITPFILLLIAIFGLQLARRKQLFALRYLLYAFLLGLGLSAFYFLPALLELQYTDVGSILGGGSDFRDHFVCPLQFWYSPWGYGGSMPGCIDGMSFQLGKPHLLLTVLSLVFLPLLYLQKNRKLFVTLLISFICLIFVIFLMLPVSQPLWEILSLMEYFQFPWRFLVVAAFLMSFISGSSVTLISQLGRKIKSEKLAMGIFLIGIGGLLFVFYVKLFIPQGYTTNPQIQVDPQIVGYEISKISDEYLPSGIEVPQNKLLVPTERIEVISGSAQITTISEKSHILEFTLTASEASTLLVQKAYFPSWKVFLNQKEIPYDVEKGKITVHVPPGVHHLSLKFIPTPVQRTGNIISVISALGLCTGIIITRKKNIRE